MKKAIQPIAIALLLFVSAGALYAGFNFIADPSGASLGMNTNYLNQSPFTNFLIPGIVLFIANGIFSVATAIAVIKKVNDYFSLIILQGIVLTGWIIAQVLMVRDFEILHLLFLLIGIILISIGVSNKQ